MYSACQQTKILQESKYILHWLQCSMLRKYDDSISYLYSSTELHFVYIHIQFQLPYRELQI